MCIKCEGVGGKSEKEKGKTDDGVERRGKGEEREMFLQSGKSCLLELWSPAVKKTLRKLLVCVYIYI